MGWVRRTKGKNISSNCAFLCQDSVIVTECTFSCSSASHRYGKCSTVRFLGGIRALAIGVIKKDAPLVQKDVKSGKHMSYEKGSASKVAHLHLMSSTTKMLCILPHFPQDSVLKDHVVLTELRNLSCSHLHP